MHYCDPATKLFVYEYLYWHFIISDDIPQQIGKVSISTKPWPEHIVFCVCVCVCMCVCGGVGGGWVDVQLCVGGCDISYQYGLHIHFINISK